MSFLCSAVTALDSPPGCPSLPGLGGGREEEIAIQISNMIFVLSACHTCDDIRQVRVKVLKQLQHIVHEEEGVIMPKQHPLVIAMEVLCAIRNTVQPDDRALSNSQFA